VFWWWTHNNELRLHVRRLQKLLLYWSVCSHNYELQVHRIVPQHSPRPSYAPDEFSNKCPLRRTTASGQIKIVEVKYLSVSAIKIIPFLLAMRAFLSPRILRVLSFHTELYVVFPFAQKLMLLFLSPGNLWSLSCHPEILRPFLSPGTLWGLFFHPENYVACSTTWTATKRKWPVYL